MDITLEMDSGDIYLQREVPIGSDETASELTVRLAELGGAMLAEVADALEAGTAQRTPQDNSAATYCQLLTKEDGYIDWSAPAERIHALVRGAQPWPAAQCLLEGEVCKIYGSEIVSEDTGAPPGAITAVEKDRVMVATGQGQLAIRVFQAPGKKAMPMGDFLRGQPLQAGTRFGEMPHG